MAVQNITLNLINDGGINSVLSVQDTGMISVNSSVALGSQTKLPILANVVSIINSQQIIVNDIYNNPIDASVFKLKDNAFISFSYSPAIPPPPNFVPVIASTDTIDKMDIVCDSSVLVGTFIYVDSNDVAKTADCSSPFTSPALGLIISKANPQLATVQVLGKSSLFSGLSAGATYYLSTSGNITNNPTTTPGQVVQKIGTAILSNVLFISIDSTITIL